LFTLVTAVFRVSVTLRLNVDKSTAGTGQLNTHFNDDVLPLYLEDFSKALTIFLFRGCLGVSE